MAQNDVLKRYLDAGLAFTALTQARAEALVKELVKAGEVQADQARDSVQDLLERSRKNSERFLDTVRTEVRQQITSLGLATQADLDRIEERIASVIGAATAPAKQAAAGAKRAPAKKAPAKKAAAKRATQKAPAKKAPAKKTTATKAPANRAPAKKSTKKA
jgi:polyhydroxyalkanoate synthesis regulator phasin